MVTLANDKKELGDILDANITIDSNGERRFSVQIARCNWSPDLTFSNKIYVPGTEFGGIIGQMITTTSLDYVELKGWTWRGKLYNKIIEPPVGHDYKKVSGELNSVLKMIIEPEFEGLFVVSEISTGVTISNYQFPLRCHMLDGLEDMLKSVGYKLKISQKREQGAPAYVLVEAVPIIDYSSKIEMSQDSQLSFTMDDYRDGINHLIAGGKGELQEREIIHLYLQKDGSIGDAPFYTGIHENEEFYDNTAAETTEELRKQAIERFKEITSKKTFNMDIESLGIDVEIGDIVGGRDYLTGLYMAKPIANIIYNVTDEGVVTKKYVLEGESEEWR